jgi:CBS domain-containing protein
MNVNDLMARDVARVRPTDPLDQAAARMRARDCGCLPVIDEQSRVVAVLTDRDVCLAALREARPLSQIPVQAAMSAELHACRADDTIAEAERLMGLHQVRRLPVVDARGRLAGLLSLDDVAREACREEDLIAPPVSEEAVGRTLGQISRPKLVQKAAGAAARGGRP